MKTPLEVIQAYGAPTHSYALAVLYFNQERAPLSKEQHEEGYADILGLEERVVFADEFDARYHFLYAVQETIRASFAGVPDMAAVADEVAKRVADLKKRQPELFKVYEKNKGSDGQPKLDAVGAPKRKKGAKKDLAIQVYNEFIKDKGLSRKDAIAIMKEKVGLSDGGASTYYANCKSGRYQ